MTTDPLPTEVQRELDAIEAALAGRAVEPDLTEIGALALALRDERPDIDPQFAGSLDTRVAAGFPKESRRSRLLARLSPGPMLVPGVALSAVLALVVAGAMLTNPGGDDDEGAGGAAGGLVDSVEAQRGQAAEDSAASGGAEPSRSSLRPSLTQPPPPVGGSPTADRKAARKIERSASMTLVARPDEIEDVGNRIIAVAPRVDGFVVTSSVSASVDGGGGNFLLRVPVDRLDDAIRMLRGLASVQSLEQATQDITAEHNSARSRLQDARAERKSLLRRLARATTDVEAESIKAQLRDVGRRIAIAKTDLARVNNRASFSNLAVSLTSDPEATDPEDDGGAWSPGDAVKDALRILEVAAGVLVIALAIALPLGLLVLVGVATSRWATRRGRQRALDTV